MSTYALRSLLLICIFAVVSGCSSKDKDKRKEAKWDPTKFAVAKATSADGTVELKGFFRKTPEGVRVRLYAKGLQPGAIHGIHIHENGTCNAPDYTSAGAHFDPTGESLHGGHEMENSHLGDLGNLTGDTEGIASKSLEVKGATLTEGSTNFVGRALILHAGQDDLTTQPAGNSGARLVCAEIKTPDKENHKEWKKNWKEHRGKKDKKDWDKKRGEKREKRMRSGDREPQWEGGPQEEEQRAPRPNQPGSTTDAAI